MVDLGAYYTQTSTPVAGASDLNMKEFTLSAGKTIGALDATLAYIYTDADDQNNAQDYNSIQAYLTLNF